MNSKVTYTNISEINIDLNIDINFFNSRIFTTNKLEKFNIQSENQSKNNRWCFSYLLYCTNSIIFCCYTR